MSTHFTGKPKGAPRYEWNKVASFALHVSRSVCLSLFGRCGGRRGGGFVVGICMFIETCLLRDGRRRMGKRSYSNKRHPKTGRILGCVTAGIAFKSNTRQTSRRIVALT